MKRCANMLRRFFLSPLSVKQKTNKRTNVFCAEYNRYGIDSWEKIAIYNVISIYRRFISKRWSDRNRTEVKLNYFHVVKKRIYAEHRNSLLTWFNWRWSVNITMFSRRLFNFISALRTLILKTEVIASTWTWSGEK